jgi:hypothetical protein
MSSLNKDILFLIFEELREDSKSLFSCLMVNRLWCENAIPILWRNPWCYNGINYSNKSSLFIIIAHYLFDNIKEYITNQKIQLPLAIQQSLLFDYLSYCRSINVNTIDSVISIGSSLGHNQFFIQQEFYYLFMKKCPELKYFDMRSIKYQIFYFPEANTCLESLCKLKCDTFIDPLYFYGLSHCCQNIQSLIINNVNSKPNYGITRLIEVQKNLKHFEWIDDYYTNEYYLYNTGELYEEILLALAKKANSLNYLRMVIESNGSYGNTLVQRILPKLYKIRILIFDGYELDFTEKQLKQLKMQVYHKLEILNIECSGLNVISSIIENSGGRLKKILFRPYAAIDADEDFVDNSLDLIRKIYVNCLYIEDLTITFPSSKEHFAEFEKLLKICQNLKSLLLAIIIERDLRTNERSLENGKELLKILIRSAPTNLKEIRFYDDFKFSLENLEEFFEKWRGRTPLSIFTSDSIYEEENYKKLINKYKIEGVIKDFRHICYHEINNHVL